MLKLSGKTAGYGVKGGRPSWWLQVGVIRADFGEFSARSYAKPVFRCVVRVSVIVAPEGILLIVHVANNRRRDQNDGYADDQSSDYQAFHFNSSFPRAPQTLGKAVYSLRTKPTDVS